MDFKAQEVDNPEFENKLKDVAKKWQNPGTKYLDFNTLKIESGLSYQEVFGTINHMRKRDPYSVRFTVNRLGDPTYVAFIK